MSYVKRQETLIKLSNNREINMDIDMDNMDIPSRCDISDLMVSFIFFKPVKLCKAIVYNATKLRITYVSYWHFKKFWKEKLL